MSNSENRGVTVQFGYVTSYGGLVQWGNSASLYVSGDKIYVTELSGGQGVE